MIRLIYDFHITAGVIFCYSLAVFLRFLLEDIFNLERQYTPLISSNYSGCVALLIASGIIFLFASYYRKNKSINIDIQANSIVYVGAKFLTLFVLVVQLAFAFYLYLSGAQDWHIFTVQFARIAVTALGFCYLWMERKLMLKGNFKLYYSIISVIVALSISVGVFAFNKYSPIHVNKTAKEEMDICKIMNDFKYKMPYNAGKEKASAMIADFESNNKQLCSQRGVKFTFVDNKSFTISWKTIDWNDFESKYKRVYNNDCRRMDSVSYHSKDGKCEITVDFSR